MSLDQITPQQAAELYRWAIGDGRREPPEDADELHRVGAALRALIEHAGSWLTWEEVELDDGTTGAFQALIVSNKESTA